MKPILHSLIAFAAAAASTAFANGSLWQAETLQETRSYRDRIGAKSGDLVTINVRLNSTGSRSGQTSTDRSSDVNDALRVFLFGLRTASTGDQGFNFYRSGPDAPSFEWGTERTFKGGGSINNREQFTTSLTARVVEVSQAGVARLEARRLFESGRERSTLVLTGFARIEDIGRDNTVESTRLADLSIHQEGSGPLTRDQQKGWLTRILETVNPF
jgi:flagellar L-ring protein precursor FlgH